MSKKFKLIPISEYQNFVLWRSQQTGNSNNDKQLLSNPFISPSIKLNMLSRHLHPREVKVLSNDSIENDRIPKQEEHEHEENKQLETREEDTNIGTYDSATPVTHKPPIPLATPKTPSSTTIIPRRRYDSRQDDAEIHKFVVEGAQIPYTSKLGYPGAVDLIEKSKNSPHLVSWDKHGNLS